MALPKHYRIDYLLNGSFKSFYIRTENMDNAEAWHCASVDAGLARIPKYRLEKVAKVSKPYAEHFGRR
ncbi:DUF6555 family protein [Pseudomonas amygdali]|uniref:DUF6555 family protein n=1 Tax=Pseudomonas amygdali TaxID=47877 RepID=UPI0009AF49D1|nr:DUF6555 family protein [Pseudomonas amygdali]ARA81236.1 hypothetical protein B5U27_14835 [Pseudomonas amygdali pv. lachrymans]